MNACDAKHCAVTDQAKCVSGACRWNLNSGGRWMVRPVEDVRDCQPGLHARYIASWDVCTAEGDLDNNYDNEPAAQQRADALNQPQTIDTEGMWIALPQRLRGRGDWLLGRGRIKDAELMFDAATEIDSLRREAA